jgi:hypothetical protein
VIEECAPMEFFVGRKREPERERERERVDTMM